jgi:hypothetical protein
MTAIVRPEAMEGTGPTVLSDTGIATPTVDANARRVQKIRRYRGPDYPIPGEDAGRVRGYLAARMRDTEPDAQARWRQTTRNLLYMYGRQYLTWSKRSRTWDELPLLGETDFRVTMNFLKPILRARSQRLLSGPIQFAARPSSNALDARDRAVLAATLIQSRFDGTSMRAKLDQCLELAFAGGVAFLKSFWNRDLGSLTPAQVKQVRREPVLGLDGQPMVDPAGEPMTRPVVVDGEVQFDMVYVDRDMNPVEDRGDAYQYRPGDTDTAVRSVFNIRLNPDCVAFDPGAGLRWLLDTDVLPIEEAREMFPEFAEQIEPGTGEDMLALTLERLAAGAAIAGSLRAGSLPSQNAPNKKSQPTVAIQEFWELPSECFPDGRLIVRVGNAIVYDDAFPHGVLPFVPIYDEPAPLTPMGRPSVNDMVSPQDLINRQWTAIDQEMRLNGVGRWVSWDHPNLPDQIVADDRAIIKVPMTSRLANKGLRDMFYRLEPGSAGGERWRIISEAKGSLWDIAGFHEVSRGQAPPGVDSGVALEHLREEEQGQLAKSMGALASSLKKWGAVQLTIGKREYGDDVNRYVAADRPDLGYILEDASGTQLPDPDDITIELEGFKAQSAAGHRAEIKEAMDKQWIDPRRGLQLLDLGKGLSPALDSQTRHYHRARWINLALERGEFEARPAEVLDPADPEAPPVQVVDFYRTDGTPMVLPDDDDHAIHLMVLDELVLDDTKPWNVRQAAMGVKAQRRRTMDLQQADAASPQAGAEPQ